MPRSAAIGQLAAALAQAGTARDWERLGAVSRALGPQLAALKARGPWNGRELAALAQLRARHDDAAAACAEALDTLGARLADMRHNKDGWIAYALAGDTDATGYQK